MKLRYLHPKTEDSYFTGVNFDSAGDSVCLVCWGTRKGTATM